MAKLLYSEWYLRNGSLSRLQKLNLNKVICIDLETTGVDTKVAEELKPIVSNPKSKGKFLSRIKKIMQNLKGTTK